MTGKRARFVVEYLKDSNATKAFVRAGYGSKNADAHASRLMKDPAIRSAIRAKQKKVEERAEIEAADLLKELGRIALADIGQAFKPDGSLKPMHEIPEDVRRTIAAVDVDELFEGVGQDRERIGVTRKIRFWDKNRALELFGKHFKLYTEKVEHSGTLTLEQLLAESQ